jgi:5-methylcytosine-specific restriction endonuclease McrA
MIDASRAIPLPEWPVREWACVTCGAHFTQPAHLPDARYCGNACRRRATGQGDNRKRARKFGVPYEPINRAKLYERDGWRCYLCGVKVRPYDRSKPADPRMATIDHVLAMSNGGGHTWDNVRTCCFRCNVSKGTIDTAVQLHLI